MTDRTDAPRPMSEEYAEELSTQAVDCVKAGDKAGAERCLKKIERYLRIERPSIGRRQDRVRDTLYKIDGEHDQILSKTFADFFEQDIISSPDHY